MAYGRFLNYNDVTELISNAPAISSEEVANLLPEATVFATKTPWSPRAPRFEGLNTVTDRGLSGHNPNILHSILCNCVFYFYFACTFCICLERFVFFTVMCDLALESLVKPVRLGCVCRAKIFPKDAVYWRPTLRRLCYEDFNLTLSEVGLVYSFKYISSIGEDLVVFSDHEILFLIR